MQHKLFTPVQIGPLLLRNRSIRAAAFEGMCQNHAVSPELIAYHEAVAAGGIGMTTVAYVSVTRDGLSFPHQLWMHDAIIPSLKKLTDAVHRHNAAASIQLGHCGNMAKRSVTRTRPVAPSARINWYAPSFPHALKKEEIFALVKSFGAAVKMAQQAGFDAVEVHAGHGYLISQFLSPYTNRRNDEFGGSLTNRMRFLQLVLDEVMHAAAGKTAVLVKMNMRDGFDGGLEREGALQVALLMERMGIHALVLSGGFVSRAPMYILRGAMPVQTLAQHVDSRLMRWLVRRFGHWLIREVPFSPTYFLDEALIFRKELKMPLVYVGGILSGEHIEQVLSEGFDAVAMARVLIHDPDFIHKLLRQSLSHSACDTCNYCIAVMYNGPFSCIQHKT
ncbi:MAG: NADH:flavin oxidoreductase [Chitinophagales bacterium]|nr:NADH:flavin oxidoreductase [Chitinophagales bacterium]